MTLNLQMYSHPPIPKHPKCLQGIICWCPHGDKKSGNDEITHMPLQCTHFVISSFHKGKIITHELQLALQEPLHTFKLYQHLMSHVELS